MLNKEVSAIAAVCIEASDRLVGDAASPEADTSMKRRSKGVQRGLHACDDERDRAIRQDSARKIRIVVLHTGCAQHKALFGKLGQTSSGLGWWL